MRSMRNTCPKFVDHLDFRPSNGMHQLQIDNKDLLLDSGQALFIPNPSLRMRLILVLKAKKQLCHAGTKSKLRR